MTPELRKLASLQFLAAMEAGRSAVVLPGIDLLTLTRALFAQDRRIAELEQAASRGERETARQQRVGEMFERRLRAAAVKRAGGRQAAARGRPQPNPSPGRPDRQTNFLFV